MDVSTRSNNSIDTDLSSDREQFESYKVMGCRSGLRLLSKKVSRTSAHEGLKTRWGPHAPIFNIYLPSLKSLPLGLYVEVFFQESKKNIGKIDSKGI